MKPFFNLLISFLLCQALSAQNVYTIKADSVKLTSCDPSELIIKNHIQGVPGFLYNTGRERTVFQRGARPIGSGMYLVGADTIKTPSNPRGPGRQRLWHNRYFGNIG